MQKIIIVIFLITSALNKNIAQIQKGSWMLGGDLHLGENTGFSDFPNAFKNEQFSGGANAEIGYFKSDRLAVGVRFGFDYTNQLNISRQLLGGVNATESNFQSYRLAPFARYYFTPKSKFKTFYELSIGGNWNRSTSADFNRFPAESFDNNYYLNVKNTLGVNYFFTQNLAFEAAIDYNFSHHINDSRETVFPKLAFNPKFGIKAFLNTEKQNSKILADRYLQKGNITIGLTSDVDLGNLNYGFLAPSIGYFLTDKWLISTGLSVYHKPNAATLAFLSPELRYYQPISPTTQVFFRGAANFGMLVDNSSNQAMQYSKTSVETGIGLNRFIAENLSVQGSVNLNAATQFGKTQVSPNLKVGFQYFINR